MSVRISPPAQLTSAASAVTMHRQSSLPICNLKVFVLVNLKTMKTCAIISGIAFVMIAFLCFTSTAQDAKQEKKTEHATRVKKMVEGKRYIIKVESAMPSGGRKIHLSPGYTLTVSGDTLMSDLPYYGRAYSPAGAGEGGYNFTSTSFEYSIADRKKGGWDIEIKIKDRQENPRFTLTIFDNGNVSLMVTGMSRENISYTGYVAEKK